MYFANAQIATTATTKQGIHLRIQGYPHIQCWCNSNKTLEKRCMMNTAVEALFEGVKQGSVKYLATVISGTQDIGLTLEEIMPVA